MSDVDDMTDLMNAIHRETDKHFGFSDTKKEILRILIAQKQGVSVRPDVSIDGAFILTKVRRALNL